MNLKTSAVRVAMATTAAVLVLPLTAGSAQAAKATVYVKSAVVSFVEMGAMPGAPGNAHSSYLEFSSSSDGTDSVRGYIFHYNCPTGFAPAATDDFNEAATELETNCTFFTEGTESLETGDVTIRMTGDQTWTKVSGYFDASLATQPTVAFNLQLKGFGPITETESVIRGGSYKQLLRDRVRSATATGQIAGVTLGDSTGDQVFTGQVGRRRVLTYTW
jgi:hypothetical protein